MSNTIAGLVALALVGLMFGFAELLFFLSRQPEWLGKLFFAVLIFVGLFFFLKGTTNG